MSGDGVLQPLIKERDEVVQRLNLIIVLLLLILFLHLYPIVGVYLGGIVVGFFAIVALELSRNH